MCLLLACRVAFLLHLACLWVGWFSDPLIYPCDIPVMCSEWLEESYVMSICFVPDLFKARAQQSDSSRESTKPCLVVCTHAWMICPKQPGWWGGRDTPALSTPSSSLLRPTENPSCIIAKTVRHHRSEVASVSEYWILNLNTYGKERWIWSRCGDLFMSCCLILDKFRYKSIRYRNMKCIDFCKEMWLLYQQKQFILGNEEKNKLSK